MEAAYRELRQAAPEGRRHIYRPTFPSTRAGWLEERRAGAARGGSVPTNCWRNSGNIVDSSGGSFAVLLTQEPLSRE